ncbi:MAG: porin [Propionivibrio sp.]|nr:porin [Propionivibrio sp.]
MQKKLIVLALAGLASSAAFAQTNVTIYGVADSSLDVINVGSTNSVLNQAPNPLGLTSNTNIGSYTRVSTNSSLLGFRGEEALGNGLKAIFQLESTVGFDANNGINLNRDSYVGLNGGFGTIRLGNQTGPTRALGAAVDVFPGATGIGTNTAILGKLGNNLVGGNGVNSDIIAPVGQAVLNPNGCARSTTCASVFDTRWRNSIAYVSPNFSGFTGTAVYVANENKTSNWTNNNPANGINERNTYGYDLGLNYNNGPIMVGLTYNAATFGTNNSNVADGANELRLAGMYNFGKFSIRGLYAQTRGELNGASNIRQNVWGIGGTWDVTPNGRLVGQYYDAGDVTSNGSLKQGASLWALGYQHSFSKRTMMYATYSYLSSDRDVAYDFGVNATGAGAVAGQGQGGVYQGLALGLRHTF